MGLRCVRVSEGCGIVSLVVGGASQRWRFYSNEDGEK